MAPLSETKNVESSTISDPAATGKVSSACDGGALEEIGTSHGNVTLWPVTAFAVVAVVMLKWAVIAMNESFS